VGSGKSEIHFRASTRTRSHLNGGTAETPSLSKRFNHTTNPKKEEKGIVRTQVNDTLKVGSGKRLPERGGATTLLLGAKETIPLSTTVREGSCGFVRVPERAVENKPNRG